MWAMQLRGEISADRPLLVVALDEEAAQLAGSVPVLVTGVGKVRSAVAVATVLGYARPAYVVNLGTAGGLRAGLDGIHEVGEVRQHDFADEAIHAITGRHFGAPIALGAGPVLTSGDAFIAGGPVRDALAAEAHLVDMEGYAVAHACRTAGVDVRLVKLVSDEADEHAARTWADSVADHAHTLADWARTHLG
jgi:adenosylhomocysteine nucleosidase